VVERGAISPTLKDPHAEFRRGNWKKPLAFAVVTAAALYGLFVLVPAADPAEKTAAQPGVGPVIGRSNGPQIIEDPDVLNPLRAKADVQTPSATAAPAATGPSNRSGNFADSFKSAAR
jgi:hypothetical protein